MKNRLMSPTRSLRPRPSTPQPNALRWFASSPVLIVPVLAVPLLAVLAVAPAQAAVTFNQATYDTGGDSYAVRSGDFNKDGKLDLVTSNYQDNMVSVLLGNGTGTFPSHTTYLVRPKDPGAIVANGLVVTDFNNDGNLDVAVTGRDYAEVDVLLGNGAGGLGAAISSPSSKNSFTLSTGDLNNDGKPDLVAVDSQSNQVTVLIGKGNGTFNSPVYYTAGQGTYAVAIADLNGDGKADLAVANNSATGGDTVSVLPGNGDGTFGAKTDYPAGRGPRMVRATDLNGDGKLDLIVSNFGATSPAPGTASLSVLLNKGDGTFNAATDYPTTDGTTSAGTFDGIGVDLDGDGKPDLVSANNNGRTVGVRVGNGDGTFGAQTLYTSVVNASPRFLVAADFNGDGKTDLAAAQTNQAVSGGPDGLLVLLNTTTPVVTNNAPTLDPIGNVSYKRNGGAHTVNLSGITDGDTGATQTLSVSASSDNTGVAMVGVNYTPSNSTGSLTITPTGVGTATITVTVTDNGTPNKSIQRSFTVTVSNATPVANAQSITVSKNTAKGITLTASDSDGDPLIYTVVNSPQNGTLSGTAPNLTYTPDFNYSGADSFTFRVSDGSSTSNTATVSLTVTNTAPVLANIESGTLTYTQGDSATQITSTIAVSDGDNANLAGATISITGGFVSSEDRLQFANQNNITGSYNASTGALTLTGSATLTQYRDALRSVTYSNINTTNPSTANRVVSFQVNDGASSNNLSNTVTRTISVALLNKAPVNSVPGAQSFSEDSQLVFSSAKGNAISISDADAGNATVKVTLSVTNGVFTLSNTSSTTITDTIANINATLNGLTYVPTANFFGSSTLTITTNDQGNTGAGGAQTDTDTVSITVNPVNDAPVAVDDSYNTAFGTQLVVSAPGVLFNDTDVENNTLSVADGDTSTPATIDPVSGPSHGTLVLNADGSFTYTPSVLFLGGDDSFTYKATDGQSANSLSNLATVTIHVAANIPPVAVDDNASTSEDAFVDINVVGNDTDADHGNLVVAPGSISNVHGGTAELQNGGKTVRFTPDANANDGNTSGGFGFTYKVSDGTSTSANSATVAIGVSAVNDAPTISSVSITPAAPLTDDTLTANVVAGDVDNATSSLSYSYMWQKTSGGVTTTLSETGPTLDLSQPGNGDNGDSLTVTVTASDATSSSAPKSSDPVTISNRVPTVDSVSPQNATDAVGTKRTFSVSVSDGNGARDIANVWLLVNTRLDLAEGATLIYVPSSTSPTNGQLYLRRGDSFIGPITVGTGATSSEVLDNGAVRVVGTDVSVSVSGNQLTLSIGATIRDGLIGQNMLYARVEDRQGAVDANGNSNGFVSFGAYTVTTQFPTQTNSAPTLSTLTPTTTRTTLNSAGIAPSPQTFGFFFKDENGTGDLESVWFLAGPQLDWSHSATFVYVTRTRRLYLRSDDGSTFLGGGQIGSPGILENSQVRVDLSKVILRVYSDGKSQGLSLPLQAKGGLAGSNKIWLRVQDVSGATSPDGDAQGFVLKGSWDIKKTDGPGASPQPSNGNS